MLCYVNCDIKDGREGDVGVGNIAGRRGEELAYSFMYGQEVEVMDLQWIVGSVYVDQVPSGVERTHCHLFN